MTPYFLPEERIVTALALAAMRGVEVDIVIPRQSNQPLVDRATRANVGPLLQAGCRIWRGPPPFEHSKLMVVDDNWALIGSANWDMRSFRLNFEMNVEVTHDALAKTLATHIEARFGDRLTAAELARRPLPTRLLDAAIRLLLPYL
jgi:cardiolipin synthase